MASLLLARVQVNVLLCTFCVRLVRVRRNQYISTTADGLFCCAVAMAYPNSECNKMAVENSNQSASTPVSISAFRVLLAAPPTDFQDVDLDLPAVRVDLLFYC